MLVETDHQGAGRPPAPGPPPPADRLPSGRHGLPPEEVARHQRARLLRAVTDVVGQGGYGTAAVEAVISRAGVSRRTFYVHFRDRQAVFLAAYDEAVDAIAGDVAAAWNAATGAANAATGTTDAAGGAAGPVPAAGPAPANGTGPTGGHSNGGAPAVDPLEAAVAAALRALAADPARARLVVLEVLAAGEEALHRRSETMGRLATAIAGDTSTTVEAVVGGLHEVVLARVLRGATAELPTLAPDLAAIVAAARPDGAATAVA